MPRQISSIRLNFEDGSGVTMKLVDRAHIYDAMVALVKGQAIELLYGENSVRKLRVAPSIRLQILGVDR